MAVVAPLDLAPETLTLRSVFQPIFDLRSSAPVAAEVLTRGPAGSEWERPDVLFAQAARLGLTTRLDRRCIETAFEAAGAYVGPIFVNVEPATLAESETTPLERFGPSLVGASSSA